ncbi:MAG: mechanosensitive ion channel family protein [Deinococcota bacterium]
MLNELLIQLQKPQVWLGLTLTLLVAYALHRFGRLLLRSLESYVRGPLVAALRWLWLLVVAVAWLAVATHVVYLPGVPVLFDLGQDIFNGFRNSAGQMLVILALALIAWNLIGSLSTRIVAEAEFTRRTVRVQTLKGVVESTLKAVVVLMSLIAGLQALGVNASSLLAGVSVLGLAVGFGAQSLIKDVFTGFFILLEDQYGVGDVITVNTGQLSGNVERLNLRLTVLRALDGTVHIIPNGQIQTVSVSSKDWSRVVATVEVNHAANLDDALRVLEAVSREIYTDPEWSHFFLEEPEIQGVTQLTPDGVTLRALFQVQPKSQYAIGREFNRRIKIAMDQAGIRIPSPQRTVTLANAPIAIRLTQEEQEGCDPRNGGRNADARR